MEIEAFEVRVQRTARVDLSRIALTPEADHGRAGTPATRRA